MTTASTEKYDNARQVDKDILESLNLKINNNLDEYILLIVGIDNDNHLSENLSRIINEDYIKWFNDIETSLAFIHSLHNCNIFLIISGTVGSDHAHKFLIEQQIIGLYVYCMDEDKHRIWTKEINKIRCTVSDATKLVTQLHRDIKELSGRWPLVEKSFQKVSTAISQWYHLFLLLICYRPECIKESYKEMFNECRAYYRNNHSKIKQIDKFQQTYKSSNVIHEYTHDSFLYRIVNHALRTKNMEIIRKFSPFIRDLNRQIHICHQMYHKSKKDNIRAVYRGQHLTMDELEYLRSVSKSNTPVITSTTFIRTSLDPEVALDFATPMNGRIPCLFEIIRTDSYNKDRNPMIPDEQAFANISSLSNMPDEQEVRFSLITHFSVKYVGYPMNQSNRTWVLIVLELVYESAMSSYNHHQIIEWIRNETDPQIYTDILDMLQVNAANELKFKSTNWQNWWNKLTRHSWKVYAKKQPLNLIFYDCFTEDKYWSRKAIDLYKVTIRSVPAVQLNRSCFLYLFSTFKQWNHHPTIQIALYEDYLKELYTENTEEVVKCLWLAGEAYRRIADQESALECYQKALDMNVNDKFRMNNKIQKQIKILQKPSKTIHTTDNIECRPVKKDSNQEFLEMYEAQQDQWILYDIIKSEALVKLSIEERLQKKFSVIFDDVSSGMMQPIRRLFFDYHTKLLKIYR